MSALDVLCAQLTRDLFAIAKFLFLDNVEGNLRSTWTKLKIANVQGDSDFKC